MWRLCKTPDEIVGAIKFYKSRDSKQIEEFIKRYKIDEFCISGKQKTTVALSKDFHFAVDELEIKEVELKKE